MLARGGHSQNQRRSLGSNQPSFKDSWLATLLVRCHFFQVELITVTLADLHHAAQVLASPSRCCPLTKTRVPSDCLQSFKLMPHPATSDPWWVPPDLSPTLPSQPPTSGLSTSASGQTTGAIRGPTVYTLSRKDFLHGFSGASGKYRRGFRSFLRVSDSPGLTSTLGRAVWREDMENHILELMRRRIYEEILHLSSLTEGYGRQYLVSLRSLDQLASLHQLGCVFTAGSHGEQNGSRGHRRLSLVIDETSETLSLPVYNTCKLLGEVYTTRLRERSTVFRGATAVVLRGTRTISLQKRVWKLQAYNK